MCVRFELDSVKLFFNRLNRNTVVTDEWIHANQTQLQIFGELYLTW